MFIEVNMIFIISGQKDNLKDRGYHVLRMQADGPSDPVGHLQTEMPKTPNVLELIAAIGLALMTHSGT